MRIPLLITILIISLPCQTWTNPAMARDKDLQQSLAEATANNPERTRGMIGASVAAVALTSLAIYASLSRGKTEVIERVVIKTFDDAAENTKAVYREADPSVRAHVAAHARFLSKAPKHARLVGGSKLGEDGIYVLDTFGNILLHFDKPKIGLRQQTMMIYDEFGDVFGSIQRFEDKNHAGWWLHDHKGTELAWMPQQRLWKRVHIKTTPYFDQKYGTADMVEILRAMDMALQRETLNQMTIRRGLGAATVYLGAHAYDLVRFLMKLDDLPSSIDQWTLHAAKDLASNSQRFVSETLDYIHHSWDTSLESWQLHRRLHELNQRAEEFRFAGDGVLFPIRREIQQVVGDIQNLSP